MRPHVMTTPLRRGLIVTIHLPSGTSVSGRVLRVRRRWIELAEHRIEVNGVMHEAASERLLVPLPVKLVEVR